MSDYNDALSKPVWVHGGEVLAPQGDGFMCVWHERPRKDDAAHVDPSCRLEACLTALEIARVAEQFNAAQPDGQRLPTRIGLTTANLHRQSRVLRRRRL